MNATYTIDDIKEKIVPVAKSHELAAVYLFGSYTRGDATGDSDIDLMIDRTGSDIVSAFDMGGLFNELEDIFGKDNVDLITTRTLSQKRTRLRRADFVNSVENESLLIYER
jgi:predicted nucleotidyltransferase